MSSPYDIDWENPKAMLDRIESEPKAFIQGRRNDDVVNWFLTMLVLEPGRPASYYVDMFKAFRMKMTRDQQWSLDKWEDDPIHKVVKLHQYYGRMAEPRQIMHYWIPVGYSHLNEVTEGQLQLVKGE